MDAGTGQKDEAKKIRLLKAEEIECRVSVIKENGLSLLLYKDARVDQRILDETFGAFGWKRSHQSIEGNLYCTVEIYDEIKKEWVAKQDVGAASYSEKEKGQASDSFKRACFNWGVGRELYTAPFIWVAAGNVSIQKKDNKFTTSDRFSVQFISYNEQREINALVIVNGKGFKVFEMKPKQESSQKPEENRITDMQKTLLEQELKRTGVSIENVLARYKIHKLEQMTPEIYTKALNGLKKSKTKEAA